MRKTFLLPLLLAALPLQAQAPRARESTVAQAAPAAPAERRSMAAAQLSGAVRLDGRLDDAAWSAAAPAGEFTQAYPHPGAAASERTEVRVLVGPDALYVGARMYDAHPDSIVAQLSRRDASGTYSDRVLVTIDSHYDRRTAFQFAVNPRGVKQDSYQYDDNREDPSWDAVWDVATAVDSLGWTAEFRIPYSQLRFTPRVSGERVWGLGVQRDIARRDERDTWSPWTRNSPGFVSSFGDLAGLQAVRAPTRLEVVPYTSARLARAPGDGADPFYHSNDWRGSMGADFQYGLPGGLTLTGTLNPDFGQVEVDPAVVNLTAFETLFPERRPFFVEGSDVFRFGGLVAQNSFANPQYFYSRRIGRAPQMGVGGSDIAYVDAPEQSTILGAVKVSGKTARGWSVGLLDAVTAREQAQYSTTLGQSGSAPVEPASNYLVGRVRRDLNQGRTVIGGIFTAANRSMADSVFGPVLRSGAYVAGIDGLHSWKNREWTLSGFLAGSRVQGSASAIARTQFSSARYYQRPDAQSVHFDPERTSLGGRMGALALAHFGKWDGSAVYQEVSPGFESNDLGYQSSADRRYFSTFLGRRVNRAGSLFRNYSYAVTSNNGWNWDGDRVYADFAVNAGATFKNFWSAGLNAGWGPNFMSDRLTRGGPLAMVPTGWRVGGNVGSDRRQKLSANLSYTEARDAGDEYVHSLSVSGSLRPSTSLSVSVGPRYERSRNTSQYVTSRGDDQATETFGRRYIFADVEQSTLSLDTRVNWSFTPNLSLEVYAQPFISAGDFSNYKQFLTPGTYDFGVYGRDLGTLEARSAGGFLVDPDGTGPAGSFVLGDRPGQRDFTVRSLRGNAVLRWEYRPGSTLFFVWQQLRGGESERGELSYGRDLTGVFTEQAQNVFVIKATYWLSR